MALVMEIIRAIRNLRSEMNIPPGIEAEIIIGANREDYLTVISNGEGFIKQLATVSNLKLELKLAQKPQQAVTAVVQGIEIFLPLKGLVDIEKEIARLEKEVDKMEQEISRLEKKLSNQGFLAKAPQEVIDKEKDKLNKYQANKEALLTRLDSLK